MKIFFLKKNRTPLEKFLRTPLHKGYYQSNQNIKSQLPVS